MSPLLRTVTIHLKSPVLWGLLLWFYLGNAYLLWSFPAWAPLPSGPRHYLISPEMDPIVGSHFIIGLLFALCGLPAIGISQLLIFIANCIVSLWHGKSYSLSDAMYVSPLIVTLIAYRIYLAIRHRWEEPEFPT